MWFKNALIYRFSQPVPFTEDDLITALDSRPARPCGSQEIHTLGWAPPFGTHSEQLLEVAGGCWLIRMQKEERVLPGSVVRDALTEKIAEIEKRDARKVYKKEKDTLKDEIVMDLLPRAFTRAAVTDAIICPKEGWIVVDAVSVTRAEDLLSLLRECTGTLPVRPLNVKLAPGACMTEWVKAGQAPEGLIVSDECVLLDTGETSAYVRCKHQDLGSDEIQQHLAVGKIVSELALHWQDKLSFTLNDRLAVKRIRFQDLLLEEADDQGGDDMAGQLQAALVVQGGTFSELIPALCRALGGEDVPQGV